MKWLAGLFAVFCALSLSGCSENSVPPEKDVLTVAYLSLTDTPPDLALVQKELNARFSERIGADLNLLPLPRGVMERQLDIMLASSAAPDLFVTDVDELQSRVSRNQLLPLDSLMSFAGRDILKSLAPEYLRVGRVHGQLYAIPSIRDFASFYGALIREDLIAEYGLRVSEVRELRDLAPLLETVKRRDPTILPLVLSDFRTLLSSYENEYDSLGDDAGVLADLRAGTRVSNLFESKKYEAAVSLARDWFLRGYFARDVDTTRETAEDCLASGRVFAALYHQKPGSAGQESRITGYSLRSVPLTPAVSTTDKVGKIIWAISAHSPRSVTAMRFLNLLYSDAELVNLIDWGIEGVHYKHLTQTVIALPDGVSPSEARYRPNHGWQFGNQFLSYVYLGDDPDLWRETAAFNASAVKSPALGFNFDPSPIKATYIAVKNVMNDYRDGLETGTLDPAVVLPVFRRKLREAGIDAVIAEKQRQVDAWTAERIAKPSALSVPGR